MRLLSVFALLALVLTGVGIYAAMATATQQNCDIAVRLALGASRLRVLITVVGQMAVVALAGVVLGTAVALAVTPFLEPLLFGVQRTDLVTYAVTAWLLAAVAIGSCYMPVRRATRLDPATILRAE